MLLLSVVVSTLSCRARDALRVFDAMDNEGIEKIIIIQGEGGEEANSMFYDAGVRVVRLPGVGLSRSRNSAINNAQGEFIWFLDDDVEVCGRDIDVVMGGLMSASVDVFVGRIRCSDRDGCYKDYSRKRSGLLGTLRVSSVEMIVRRSSLMERGLKFNELMGLGARFPSGEENLFLIDCFRAGLRFHYHESCIVAHPCLEKRRGDGWNNNSLLRSKGILARDISGCMGVVLMAFWSVRAAVYTKRFWAPFFIVIGYLFDWYRVRK